MELKNTQNIKQVKEELQHFYPECHWSTSGTARKKGELSREKSKWQQQQETQTREKTNRKLTKCALGAAGDNTSTKFTGPSFNKIPPNSNEATFLETSSFSPSPPTNDL